MSDSNRKLATILATDCVNFSKHMESDEEKTLRNLNDCRKIIDAKISRVAIKNTPNMKNRLKYTLLMTSICSAGISVMINLEPITTEIVINPKKKLFVAIPDSESYMSY